MDEFGKFIIVNSKFISSDGTITKYSNKQICPLYKNDIVMVMSDVPKGKAIAKCMLIDTDNKYTLNQRICSLRAKETPFFYLLQINRNDYFLKFDDGVKQTNLRKEDILSCPIYETMPQEQQKIADFLSLVDELIEKQRQLVEVLKRYKRGCFIYAYGQYPTNNYCIKDLGKMLSTGTLSKDDIITDGKHPCILYGELFTRYAEIIVVVDSRTNKMPTCMGKPNDILFPTSTTVDALSLIAPSALRVDDVSLGGDMFVIRINENHDNRFVSYLINYLCKNSLAKYAQGTTIIHLHYTDIMNHVLTLPQKAIQQKIADFMDELEQTIIKEDKILARLLTTKSALLQQMFI
ncbi:MAG: restriction endonuclease subunit S [Alphaproteobacteria bacterium]|nr:restriction endonuclease subunit S [Alphaproteobacteria bacterium]